MRQNLRADAQRRARDDVTKPWTRPSHSARLEHPDVHSGLPGAPHRVAYVAAGSASALGPEMFGAFEPIARR
jgi:hypothetical protein